jgi:hypothetical protein
MLHAPDFLGYEDAIRMSAAFPDKVRTGLELKKLGNEIVALLGGREIHPINVRVGGFYRIPSEKEIKALAPKLEWAREAAVEMVRWVSGFPFPDFEQDYEFVSLRHPDEYPLNEGRIVSSRGLDIDIAEYNEHFEEEQVRHSSALHSTIRGRGNYLVGPLARFNLNFDQLAPLARESARRAGVSPPCANPFRSIIVRSVETLHAVEEALRIIETYEPPDRPAAEIRPREGTGHGCTEAPRGLLYHRYRLGEDGTILEAKIVPPTSQNQKTIEGDLHEYVTLHMELPDDRLQWHCEQAVPGGRHQQRGGTGDHSLVPGRQWRSGQGGVKRCAQDLDALLHPLPRSGRGHRAGTRAREIAAPAPHLWDRGRPFRAGLGPLAGGRGGCGRGGAQAEAADIIALEPLPVEDAPPPVFVSRREEARAGAREGAQTGSFPSGP